MADKKITDLQLIEEVTDDVNLPGDDSIQTYRLTVPQLAAYIDGKYQRRGVADLSNGVQSKAVVFGVALADALYTLNVTFQNVTDTDPIFLNAVVTSKSTAGFTVTFNAPTDSANYKMNWKAGY